MCMTAWLLGLEEFPREEKKEHPCSVPIPIEEEREE